MRGVSSRPKVMLPVAGKPILEHQVEWLKSAGFDEIFFCLGYKAELIKEYFGDGSRWGVRMHYSVESEPRGTAGAVADLKASVRDDLLIVYGDLYVQMGLSPLLDFHAGHDGSATLVVRKTDHPEDSDLVEIGPEGGIVKIGRREADGITSDLGCVAIWVVRRRLLDRIPTDKPSDFARDLFPRAVADGERLMAYRTEELVRDVGTPDRYERFK